MPGSGRDEASLPASMGWPAEFVPVDARLRSAWPTVEELAGDSISLLGRTRRLTSDLWGSTAEAQLWRFHLHYWDWAWGLVRDGSDRHTARLTFERWYRSWDQAARYGRMDEWSPYVASLRAWSWCGQFAPLVSGSSWEREFLIRLRQHQDFLMWNLERDVGGNHLVKNLKALVGLAAFFGDDRLMRRALNDLLRETERQVLPDGGHYERAPNYHCQVMADVLDVHDLLTALGHPGAQRLTSVLERMRSWLDTVVDSGGRLPALNDGYGVPAELLTALLPSREPAQGVRDLPDTGLTIVERGPWRVVFDSGDPCPDELPAHAHADTLALELSVGGVPLVVDTGTSTYEAGPTRAYERSTAAHSTVDVDGANSTEVWGAFRAGRRARVLTRSVHDSSAHVELTATHGGYRWLKGMPVHGRRIRVSDEAVVIADEISGSGRHDVRLRYHLAVGAAVESIDECTVMVRLGDAPPLRIFCDRPIDVQSTPRALGHASVALAPSLVIGGTFVLPAVVSTHFAVGSTDDARQASHGAAKKMPHVEAVGV